MKKLNYIPCLCVLNITSWMGYSPDAEHVYGHLTLVEQPDDPDYGPINIDTIEDWRPGGEVIELKKRITLDEAKLLDKKSNGHSYERNFMLGGRTPINKFNSIEEVTKYAIRKYKNLKLNCDFISLYEWEKFKGTVIIKK
jgi:hypothetical protein